jgi:8-oxo-dGTP diphosphatase
MRRELLEEAGITATAMTLRGTINWTGFGPDGEDWLGFIFLITAFGGEPFDSNEEGTLDWHPVVTMMDLPMWEGDRHFLPLVFDDDQRAFHGYMPYDGGTPLSWEFTRI